MKDNFLKIRSALEEHLSAINENSNEIQSLFDYLQDMEIKIDALHNRLDSLQIDSGYEKKNIKPLNNIERQIFVVLYTAGKFLCYEEIASRSKITVNSVAEYLHAITSKGIPLTRSLVNKKILVQIDSKFKERQAKENLINLSLDTFF
jgi:hypothetical protein